MVQTYNRKGIYSIESILSKRLPTTYRKNIESIVLIDGDMSYMCSQRYEVFDVKGTTCASCGIEGKYFAKEQALEGGKMWHFNLYALDSEGNEVLMTKDHIVAKSNGGTDTIENYQTMCEPCNQAKGNN